ncbi:MAG TPA: hypothetical protein VKB14_08795, partial [Actinomycetales bacterium]|nr:hypothetical protein [Actinomycetales bacterium]
PPWSWYAGDAAATAVFEMQGGTRYVFNGSWCSPGAETSWNGSWRVSAQKGTALWNGDDEPRFEGEAELHEITRTCYSGIDGALQVFVRALRTGELPMGEIHENLLSLAMVEAAVESVRTGRHTMLDDVLERAYDAALRQEQRADVRAALDRWTSVRAALAAPWARAAPPAG